MSTPTIYKLIDDADQCLVSINIINDQEIEYGMDDTREVMTIIEFFTVNVYDYTDSDIPLLTVTTLDDSVPDYSSTNNYKINSKNNYVTYRRFIGVGTNSGYKVTMSSTLSQGYLIIYTYSRS